MIDDNEYKRYAYARGNLNDAMDKLMIAEEAAERNALRKIAAQYAAIVAAYEGFRGS